MLTFCINLDRSPDRWSRMLEVFPNENLIRISAVDGRQWESGDILPDGRPDWNPYALDHLRSCGMLSESFADGYRLIPGELGCTLSHRRVWQKMVDENIDSAIVLEDDVKPAFEYPGTLSDNFAIPADADVMFLSGPDKLYNFGNNVIRPCITMSSDGTVVSAFGTYAYAITREGAINALRSTYNNVLPLPSQWFPQAFRGYLKTNRYVSEQSYASKASGVKRALIEVSAMDNKSMLTPHGLKPWRTKGIR